jgi:hypothetical protein
MGHSINAWYTVTQAQHVSCYASYWERSAAYGSAIRRSVSLMILLGKAMANRLIDTRVVGLV